MNELIQVGDFAKLDCGWGVLYFEVTAIEHGEGAKFYGRQPHLEYCEPIALRAEVKEANWNDYEIAMKRVDALMNATSQHDTEELNRLASFCEAWEKAQHWLDEDDTAQAESENCR